MVSHDAAHKINTCRLLFSEVLVMKKKYLQGRALIYLYMYIISVSVFVFLIE